MTFDIDDLAIHVNFNGSIIAFRFDKLWVGSIVLEGSFVRVYCRPPNGVPQPSIVAQSIVFVHEENEIQFVNDVGEIGVVLKCNNGQILDRLKLLLLYCKI
jgi:hypothetical protein